MVYILQKQVSGDLKCYRALISFFGLGHSRVFFCLALLGITNRSYIRDLKPPKIDLLNLFLSRLVLDRDLKRLNYYYLFRHTELGSYKGIRFKQGLPSNGQRTHTNARTARRFKEIVK